MQQFVDPVDLGVGNAAEGVVNLTTYGRKEALVSPFKLLPLHAILPRRQFEIGEAFGGISDVVER